MEDSVFPVMFVAVAWCDGMCSEQWTSCVFRTKATMKASDVLRNMKCPHRLTSLKHWSPAGVRVGKVVEPLVGKVSLGKVGPCKEALKLYSLSPLPVYTGFLSADTMWPRFWFLTPNHLWILSYLSCHDGQLPLELWDKINLFYIELGLPGCFDPEQRN